MPWRKMHYLAPLDNGMGQLLMTVLGDSMKLHNDPDHLHAPVASTCSQYFGKALEGAPTDEAVKMMGGRY